MHPQPYQHTLNSLTHIAAWTATLLLLALAVGCFLPNATPSIPLSLFP